MGNKVQIFTLLIFLVCCSCAGGGGTVMPSIENNGFNTSPKKALSDSGGYISWGSWDLVIARDGSWAEIAPKRSTAGKWGYHLNVLPFLEDSPCGDCLTLSNMHVLPNGDVSLDVSIRHPYQDPVYTGFDVRGIIIFPASQYVKDNELMIEAGLPPDDPDWWRYRYSSAAKGDAVLVNTEGWTFIWAPEESPLYKEFYYYDLDEGLPIFDYYEGKYASGEEPGNLNPFIRFFSNENRHMFEAGKTVTRTYIIRPPQDGPIKASYSVYAHWAPPANIPVTDPAVDFPPKANSPMPYEFWITQDEPIDPDEDHWDQAPHIHYHVKTWDIGSEYWTGQSQCLLVKSDVVDYLIPHPGGEPDDYYDQVFSVNWYDPLDDAFPGSWPFIFQINTLDPQDPDMFGQPLGSDYYILNVDILESDGE